MTVEAKLHSLLNGLVSGRCYPDTTPAKPEFPCITYQVTGGQTIDYLERKLPDTEHYRVQVNCWARSRVATRALALEVRRIIIEEGQAFVSAQTMGQAISQYEEALKLYGTQQDFGLRVKERP